AQADYRIEDFGLAGSGALPAAAIAAPGTLLQMREEATLSSLERDAIAAALEQAQGNISHAARMLGVSRAALYRKLDKHGI
ncbi:MAG TPA: helix-turn-helix domain-containing protein, partial [Pseudoduganella sp.]